MWCVFDAGRLVVSQNVYFKLNHRATGPAWTDVDVPYRTAYTYECVCCMFIRGDLMPSDREEPIFIAPNTRWLVFSFLGAAVRCYTTATQCTRINAPARARTVGQHIEQRQNVNHRRICIFRLSSSVLLCVADWEGAHRILANSLWCISWHVCEYTDEAETSLSFFERHTAQRLDYRAVLLFFLLPSLSLALYLRNSLLVGIHLNWS